MTMIARPRTVPRDAAIAVEWSGGQGTGVWTGVVHTPLVEEGSGVATDDVEVVLYELEVVDASSAATTIVPWGIIVNIVIPRLDTGDP
jgi:hypothetical protein